MFLPFKFFLNKTNAGVLILGLHRGEEDDVADALGVREQHDGTVDPHAHAARRRQPVFQRVDKVFVEGVRFLVALILFTGLIREALALVERIVELAEGVGEFPSVDEKFEAVSHIGVLFVALRERRDDGRVADDECRLDEVFLDIFLKENRQDIETRVGGVYLQPAQRGLTARLFVGDVHEVDADMFVDERGGRAG